MTQPTTPPDWLVWDGRCSDRSYRLLAMLLARKAEGRGLARIEALEALGCSSRSLDRSLAQLRALGLVPSETAYHATSGATPPPVALPGLAGHPPVSPSSPGPPPPPLPPRPSSGYRVDSGRAAAPVALWGEVDQVPVGDAEHALAEAVLDHFNLQLGTSFRAGTWREKIVRRAREHRELTGVDHLAVVEHVLREDWWAERPPTPSIVYGSADQFERCLAAMAKRPRDERAALSADARAAAEQWAQREREVVADDATAPTANLSNRRLAELLAGRMTTTTEGSR